MNILAFDTCFAACSAAAGRSVANLGHGESAVASRFEAMERGHAERLVAMLGEVMADARLEFSELDRVPVTHGAGSFTGTRISVAAARALALSHPVEIVAASSLAVMAEGAARELAAGLSEPSAASGADGCGDATCARLAIAVDARRGEVYVQHFRSGGGDPLTDPLLLTVEDAARLGGSTALVVAGSAAEQVAAAARAIGRKATAHLGDLLPKAEDLARLAARGGPTVKTVAPLYMRPADAKPQMGKAIERAR